jgi:predicted Rossmann fold nucleotide-binding protein DprA/Smf involved in DNA uptake
MNEFLTDDTKAILLLCGVFSKEQTVKPLSIQEYSALVSWLIKIKMRPSNLLQKDIIGDASLNSGINKERLDALLARGIQLGFAVEEWQRNGIWIISRSDSDYPSLYKKHLREYAPPLLYGVGDRSLLKGGGFAIVGSRNIDKEGEHFTEELAKYCVSKKMPVVSGGARGVDQIAMNTSLDCGGVTIGIIADNLLKKSLIRQNRYAIAKKRLILISPYHPNSLFSVGTVMARNKLIYAMADYALVVSAEYKKGGTWAGAVEELKRKNSRSVFVRLGENVPKGNLKLIDFGAKEWLGSIEKSNNNFNEKTQQKFEQPTFL